VRVFNPAAVPSVQLVAVAIPFLLVTFDIGDTEPPPLVTAKVTVTPLSGVLFASLIITLGGVDTAVPAIAD
jgi:hypothetical protein